MRKLLPRVRKLLPRVKLVSRAEVLQRQAAERNGVEQYCKVKCARPSCKYVVTGIVPSFCCERCQKCGEHGRRCAHEKFVETATSSAVERKVNRTPSEGRRKPVLITREAKERKEFYHKCLDVLRRRHGTALAPAKPFVSKKGYVMPKKGPNWNPRMSFKKRNPFYVAPENRAFIDALKKDPLRNSTDADAMKYNWVDGKVAGLEVAEVVYSSGEEEALNMAPKARYCESESEHEVVHESESLHGDKDVDGDVEMRDEETVLRARSRSPVRRRSGKGMYLRERAMKRLQGDVWSQDMYGAKGSTRE